MIRKERIGEIVQCYNFNMPVKWNRINYNDWTRVESLHKEIEMESMWREYFTANGNTKESNKSYWRVQALKKSLLQAIQLGYTIKESHNKPYNKNKN